MVKLGEIHQAAMAMLVTNKLVPGGDPGAVGAGMYELRKREALLVDTPVDKPYGYQ